MYPKQFVDIFGNGSLFQQTCRRVDSVQFHKPIILTNTDHRFLVAEQMQQAGIEAQRIVLEPVGRNTAPSILIASLLAARENEHTLLLVMPADHIIDDSQAFQTDVVAGAKLAKSGQIVTFGIRPESAKTAYGYIETVPSHQNIVEVKSFVEKPDIGLATKFLEMGNYYWNSGIFLFSASGMIEAFRKHQPEILKNCVKALADSVPDLDFLRLESEAYAACENISIDYAIMEKSSNIYCKTLTTGWTDLGSWTAVAEQYDADDQGNHAHGDVMFQDSEDCFGYSNDGLNVTLIGMKKAVVVATKDSILIVAKDSVELVKQIVDRRRTNNQGSPDSHRRVYRPWGWYEEVFRGTGFQVKCLMVNPGGVLSLQSHRYRAEHWVTVSGTAKVTVGDKVSFLSADESTYIPLGAVHRLENPGKESILLIEVQTGSYFGEDDIVRYEDSYNREIEENKNDENIISID